ncbi:MAG: DUF3473 domain-containing protein [Gemmataceae bacterium]|nr:DUF3473 domain-containing protein [Gemmataceae bacterium]
MSHSTIDAKIRIAETPDVPAITNSLTIDVEDYFQVSAFESFVRRDDWGSFESRVVNSTQRILDVLGEANTRATFFVLGWVAEQHPALVRAIARAGHEIGSHSYWHRLIYQQTPDEFRRDLRRSRQVLEDVTGYAVAAYRAPSFSITRQSLWAFDILIQEGFTIDSSVYPVVHDRYGIPDAIPGMHRVRCTDGDLIEFPPPVWRPFGMRVPVGGGGYFRLYPYALTRWGLRSINQAGQPFAAYLHPWELDPTQPRLSAGVGKSIRHYVNLRRTEQRLRHLVRDFSLQTMSEAIAQVEATSVLPEWDLRERSHAPLLETSKAA